MKSRTLGFATALSTFTLTSLLTFSAVAGPLVSSGGSEQLLASCANSKLELSVVRHSHDMSTSIRRNQADGMGAHILSAPVLQIDTPDTKLDFASVAVGVPVFELTIDLTSMVNGAYPASLTTEINGKTMTFNDVTCTYALLPEPTWSAQSATSTPITPYNPKPVCQNGFVPAQLPDGSWRCLPRYR